MATYHDYNSNIRALIKVTTFKHLIFASKQVFSKMVSVTVKKRFSLIAHSCLFVGCCFFVWGTIQEYREGRSFFQETTEPLGGTDNPTIALCFEEIFTNQDTEYGKSNYGSFINMTYDDLKLKEGTNYLDKGEIILTHPLTAPSLDC